MPCSGKLDGVQRRVVTMGGDVELAHRMSHFAARCMFFKSRQEKDNDELEVENL